MKQIVGAVPRLEAQQSHQDFVSIAAPSTVLVDIVAARKLVKRGETAASYCGPECAVITTTTVSDDQLNRVSWQRELELVEAFAPDYHIPTDVATYIEHTPAERRENVVRAMEGTVWMDKQLRKRSLPTEIVPLVKGITPAEREICYQTCGELGVNQCAFYGAQYLTGGPRLTELQKDVTAVAAELEQTDGTSDVTILLIGLLSPLYLSRMPDAVVAASGLRWVREVEPRSASPGEIQEQYATMAAAVTDALGGSNSTVDVSAGTGPPEA